MSESFYNILEVPENATTDEIKKSYRRLSMLHHPDKNKNDPASVPKFQKIGEAYETLGDPEKKATYDATRKNPFLNMMNGGRGGPPDNMFNGSVDELFSSLFGMGGMGGMHGMPGMGGMGGMPFGPNIRVFQNGVPVNIHQGFGQGFQKPTPIIKTINVAIDKILTGTTIPVDIERWIIDSGNKIFENETIYITIPKGIDDGEIIVIGEKGNVANETCKGDIKIFIKVENNTEFQRSGLDLILQKCITLKEALCGFTFDLKYLTGKIFTITNNSGNIISHGYKKIIPNMGFTREGHTGNLLIVFDVKFPEKMSNETIESLKNIDF